MTVLQTSRLCLILGCLALLYFVCTGKSLSLLCCLMLQSVDHWSILESPKSSIIAVVGEADQKMLFAARGGVNYQNVRLYCRALHGPETMLKGQHFSTLTYEEMECLLSYLYLVLVVIACETFLAVCFRVRSSSRDLKSVVLNAVVWHHQIIVVT